MDYSVLLFLCAFSQSFMCPLMRVAVSSEVRLRPYTSTKLFSGSTLARLSEKCTHQIKED